MARAIHRLSARFVATVKEPGYHADGGNLHLQVSPTGSRSWILRYTLNGRAREMGMGSTTLVSLAQARESALQARKLLSQGIDPLARRDALKALQPRLWKNARDEFIAAREPEWRNDAQGHQWRQSLRDYGPADDLPVGKLDTDAVIACLLPLWKPTSQGGRVETATRVMGRIARIWDAEKVKGNVSGDNPARWKGHLEHILPKPRKVQPQGHHKAMPYTDLPAFMVKLRERGGVARKALEFTILTAARTDEVTGAPWSEFSGALWRIPGNRMKMGTPHEVPLVARCVAILATLPRTVPPFPLSENGMLALLQDDLGQPYTVHGFRSAFSDWAHETTGFPKHVIDKALAHKVKDKADAAYRRGALLDKRHELMEAWAAYLQQQAMHA